MFSIAVHYFSFSSNILEHILHQSRVDFEKNNQSQIQIHPPLSLISYSVNFFYLRTYVMNSKLDVQSSIIYSPIIIQKKKIDPSSRPSLFKRHNIAGLSCRLAKQQPNPSELAYQLHPLTPFFFQFYIPFQIPNTFSQIILLLYTLSNFQRQKDKVDKSYSIDNRVLLFFLPKSLRNFSVSFVFILPCEEITERKIFTEEERE